MVSLKTFAHDSARKSYTRAPQRSVRGYTQVLRLEKKKKKKKALALFFSES